MPAKIAAGRSCVGKREQPWWDFQVMQLGGLQIYDQARTRFDKTEWDTRGVARPQNPVET
jgi:hypothetical protein